MYYHYWERTMGPEFFLLFFFYIALKLVEEGVQLPRTWVPPYLDSHCESRGYPPNE